MRRLFADTVTACDYSENLIVIKTLPGGANTVASALDHANWSEVIGTLAGDDTILVIIKPKEATEKILKRLQEYLK